MKRRILVSTGIAVLLLAALAANVHAAEVKITASDGAAYDYFGASVAVSGDYAVVGALGNDGTGSAYIFKRNGTAWTEQAKITASDGAASDYFGYSVAISGDYAVVGACRDGDTGSDSGSAYIYDIPVPYVFTTADAGIALEIAVGSRPSDPHWDVSGDGSVTSLDALMILQAAVGGASAQSIAIKAGDGSDLPDSILVGETFTVLITDDGNPVGAGTNVIFRLPYDTGDPVYLSTDDNGKVRYKPLVTGTLGIRVLDGTVTVAEATVEVI